MTSIGSVATVAPYVDRATQIRDSAKASNGRFTEEEVAARLEEYDRIDLKHAQLEEAFFSGQLKPLAGTSPEVAANALAQAREARSQHYTYVSGPVTIEAMNVDSAVKAQSTMTGGDLKNLSHYADYLRSELDAAKQARPDVTFTGTWGKDRVTNDVNEYIGWLYQAAQSKSQGSEQTG